MLNQISYDSNVCIDQFEFDRNVVIKMEKNKLNYLLYLNCCLYA